VPTSAGHAFGRDKLLAVWPSVLGGAPSVRARQLVQAVSAGEGGYGLATYRRLSIPEGVTIGTTSDSNNWGAVQCGTKLPCSPSCFVATDSSPRLITDANPRGLYDSCYRRHATPEEGAAAYLKTLVANRAGVRAILESGSATSMARAMFESGYYEGYGPTKEARIANYAKGIMYNATNLSKALGEPLLVSLPESSSVPAPGSSASASGGAGAVALVAIGLGVVLWARGKR
jgi:hypothetical protein